MFPHSRLANLSTFQCMLYDIRTHLAFAHMLAAPYIHIHIHHSHIPFSRLDLHTLVVKQYNRPISSDTTHHALSCISSGEFDWSCVLL
jgi:hypothetical protein